MSLRTKSTGWHQEFLSQAAVAYGGALVPKRFEESRNDFSNRLFVVDDQYFGLATQILKEVHYTAGCVSAKAPSVELRNDVLNS